VEQLTIEIVPAVTDDVRSLIEALDRELSLEYSPEQRHGLVLDAIFEPHVRFFVARLGGLAVGCGGVGLFEGFGEVKRMYVRDTVRGRGVAQALLVRIEAETVGNGFDVLRLETGDRQLAAMRLYEKAGFRRCEAFGAYTSLGAQALAASIFFEKRLSRSATRS
jgi:putative acetyltransferase